MSPIRVMHIIARMNVGGPAVEVAMLMRGLDPKRFDQRLVTGYCATDEADYLAVEGSGVPVRRIRGLGRSPRPIRDLLALRELVAEIRAFKPHIVHTHTTKAGVVGRIAARLARVDSSIVHTFHGHLLHGYFGTVRTRMLVGIERGLARFTDLEIAVGRKVRDDLLAAGVGDANRFEVIYSGVRLRAVPTRIKARTILGIDSSKTVVTYMGRVTAIKRPDRLFEVMQRVARMSRNTEFLVVGWGDQGPVLESWISEAEVPARMLGWTSDIETVLAATDVMLLTSDNEGVPLSLIEASLAGVPSVSTSVGSVSEVVIHGVTGLLAPTEPGALAQHCLSLINSAQLREELGRAATQYALENFDPRRFLESHAHVYERLGPAATWSD